MNKPVRTKLDRPQGIPEFLNRAAESLHTAETSQNYQRTRASRVEKKFPIKDVVRFLGVSRKTFDQFVRKYPVPKGEQRGREVLYTADDIMRLRIAFAAAPEQDRENTVHWRSPGDQLPVIVIGSQKGGSGKSITSANLACFLQAEYGLRVLLADADPQATSTLYFANDSIDTDSIDTRTFTNFMGLQEPGEPVVWHDADELNSFFFDSAWPGIRLLPGGASIQESDIGLFLYMQRRKSDEPIFAEMFRKAIERYDAAYQPKSQPRDLVDKNGEIIEKRYQAAMRECVDVIIVDCAPALSMGMLNAIVAGTSLIIPTPVKGWDLHTAKMYTSSAADLLNWLEREQGLEFQQGECFILPTIVSTTTAADLITLKELIDHDGDIFCPVFYKRSDAVANAAVLYQSLYEYVPPKGKKKSTEDFIEVANAVGDAIQSRCLPHLPSKGYANRFIETMYGGAVLPWVEASSLAPKIED